jgi:hypothetical protein
MPIVSLNLLEIGIFSPYCLYTWPVIPEINGVMNAICAMLLKKVHTGFLPLDRETKRVKQKRKCALQPAGRQAKGAFSYRYIAALWFFLPLTNTQEQEQQKTKAGGNFPARAKMRNTTKLKALLLKYRATFDMDEDGFFIMTLLDKTRGRSRELRAGTYSVLISKAYHYMAAELRKEEHNLKIR